MHNNDFEEEKQVIYDLNLSYLLLAQRLIREEKSSAGFRLGLSEETMDIIKELTLSQLIKLASTNQLICRLRVDDSVVLDCLTKDSRIEALQHIHTGIILSTDLLNSLSEQSYTATS
ncbi:flagellar transcriptional regulator FlhD [Enterobacter pasteurii]|uniref:flagellar transcriptional regulator FlhD n=1 Tax=Enterobacter pasteurii TaxID=3029761 RepID=UPI0011DDB86A|nr:flagellar transcriptional regulator FlhD [Enterobacter pasteurii]QLA68105.1 flagellar transcriptional regulator FlhD [Enterobacter pasteurii]